MGQHYDGVRGGVEQPDKWYHVRIERTTTFESDFYGTLEDCISTARREADSFSSVTGESVSVSLSQYATDQDRALAALSDEETGLFCDIPWE